MKTRGLIVLGVAVLSMHFAGLASAENGMKTENEVKVCVVCGPEEGMSGREELSSEYEGKTYYFCSRDCLKSFEKSPETFMENMKGDGKESHEGHDHGSHGDDAREKEEDHKGHKH